MLVSSVSKVVSTCHGAHPRRAHSRLEPLRQQIHRPQHQQRCRRQTAAATSKAAAPTALPPAIKLTDKALEHLKKLRNENGSDRLLLRIGVRSGGCSGMSYMMDFEAEDKVTTSDSVIEHEGIKLVCDPKSLLYLFGLELDYSSALIGGGLLFKNPNASDSCGCGKSFGV